MKEPTLEEVREHFKDAKVVRSQYSGKNAEITGSFFYSTGDIHARTKKGDVEVWSNSRGYAEIVEYKDDIVSNINKGIKIINEMETQENKTDFKLEFETVGAVQVTLTGKNIENLTTIANMIK